MAVLMTSSELPELLTVSDRILVLCEGRLTAEFTRAEANEERHHARGHAVPGSGGGVRMFKAWKSTATVPPWRNAKGA